MLDVKEMGKRIKDLRGDRSQDECAKALGISRGALSFYENGDRKPDADVLYKMSEYFGVPSDYILGLSTVDSYDTDLQSVCDYTGLSKNAIITLKNTAESFANSIADNTSGKIEYDKTYKDGLRDYYFVINEILSNENFHLIVYELFNQHFNCESQHDWAHNFILQKMWRKKHVYTNYNISFCYMDIENDFDLSRYKISKYIEKLSDLFDIRVITHDMEDDELIDYLYKRFGISKTQIFEEFKEYEKEKLENEHTPPKE